MLGAAYYSRGTLAGGGAEDLRRAAESFEQVIGMGVQKEYLYINAFTAWQSLGEYDQAEAVLEKVRDNPAQSGLSGAGARRDNVRGVYRIREGAQVAGKRFLLVDDVLTTGSTLSECAATLLAAGAAGVVSCALATPGARENSGTLDEKTINKAKTAGKWSKNRM